MSYASEAALTASLRLLCMDWSLAATSAAGLAMGACARTSSCPPSTTARSVTTALSTVHQWARTKIRFGQLVGSPGAGRDHIHLGAVSKKDGRVTTRASSGC